MRIRIAINHVGAASAARLDTRRLKPPLLGWSVVEAITAGLPVVSTRMSAIPEMVLDGQIGFLCNKDDESAFEAALLKLVENPALRAQMSSAARQHAVVNYNADYVYNGLMDRLCALHD